MIRIPALLTGLATLAAAANSAVAQCPIDFFPYFTERPNDLAPGNNVVNRAFDITAMQWFDPDGSGPLAQYIVAAIHYTGAADCAGPFTIASEWTRLDRWDPAAEVWVPLSPRFDGLVSAMATFDENPSDSTPPALYIGGRFSGWSGFSCSNIMRFNGANFSSVRNGVNGDVHVMTVFDDDGAGAGLPKLYVGGDMTAANSWASQGQVNCGRLLRLTGGQRWENPSSGFDDRVFALCPFDDDGAGPRPTKLVVGGAFSRNDTLTHELISVWDGSSWGTLAGGGTAGPDRESSTESGLRIFALHVFDEDGTGPLAPSLFAGGTFQRIGSGISSPLMAKYRRSSAGVGSWSAVGLGPDMEDGATLQPCGTYCSNVPHLGNRVRVTCFGTLDLDGTGPGQPELYAGGALDQVFPASESYKVGMTRFNIATQAQEWVNGASGTAWGNSASPWYTSAGLGKDAFCMLGVPGTASVPPRLLIAGGFIGSGFPIACQWNGGGHNTTFPSAVVTAWGSAGAGPTVSNQPDNAWTTLPASTTAGFALSHTGTGPFTYRWRKDGVDLNNGSAQGFGAIIGATGAATILGGTANPVNVTSQGWYDCRVSNACGTGYSTSAWLVVQPDATPYFPIRFDAAVAPVTTPIGNAPMTSIFGTGTPWPRFYSLVGSTPFAIAPTGNNAWRSRLASGSATGTRSVTIPTSRFGVGEVYTMLNTDGSSNTNVRFTFSATGGLSYTTTLTGGNALRSFALAFGPQVATSVDTSNVFEYGFTRMDKQRILLPNSFRGQTLTSITISDLGTDSTGRAILAGLTLRQRPPACGPSDIAGPDQVLGSDGFLSADDIIVFLGWFFGGDFRADVAGANQSTTPDGVLTADDIIVFLGRYFAGC